MYTRRDWRVMTIVDAAMVGMVPDGSRWFQRGPDGSRRFQMVPDGSRWFQLTVSKLTCACWDNPLETIATGLAGRFLALNIRHALPWSVRSTALFKLKIRKWTDRSNIKSCTGVHIFTFAPQSRPIWLLCQSRPICLNKLFAPTAGPSASANPRRKEPRDARRETRDSYSAFTATLASCRVPNNIFKFFCFPAVSVSACAHLIPRRLCSSASSRSWWPAS